MHPEQSRLLAEERIRDAERDLAVEDEAFDDERRVVLRPARPEDAAALVDGTPLLVAEVDGELAAVILSATA